jgi:hypothetical protein
VSKDEQRWVDEHGDSIVLSRLSESELKIRPNTLYLNSGGVYLDERARREMAAFMLDGLDPVLSLEERQAAYLDAAEDGAACTDTVHALWRGLVAAGVVRQ